VSFGGLLAFEEGTAEPFDRHDGCGAAGGLCTNPECDKDPDSILNPFATATQRTDFELASRLGYMQGNIRDQVQQDNTYFVNRHSRIVKHVKLLH
jgi:hypothetical protein